MLRYFVTAPIADHVKFSMIFRYKYTYLSNSANIQLSNSAVT